MRTLSYGISRHFVALIAFGVIIAVGLGCNLKSDSEWKKELSSKKLSRASNSGSVSTKVNIYFCSNGEYAKQSQFSGFSTGGAGTLSMADEDVELGRWTVDSGTLVLRSEAGETEEYNISQGFDAEVIELNGNGYLVSTHNECER